MSPRLLRSFKLSALATVASSALVGLALLGVLAGVYELLGVLLLAVPLLGVSLGALGGCTALWLVRRRSSPTARKHAGAFARRQAPS